MPIKSLLTAVIFILVFKSVSFAQVVINEIQAAPAKNEPEWIELYNPNDKPVVLSSPYFNDGSTSKKINCILTIQSCSFALITSDTGSLKTRRNIPAGTILIQAALPSLNNTTDIIVLRNSDSTVIDSVYYDYKWGKKGFSLERRDWEQQAVSSANLTYSISQDSCTPGRMNSVSMKDYDARPEISTDSKYINVKIINCGKKDINNLSFNVYLNKKDDLITGDSKIKSEDISFLKKSDILIFKYANDDLMKKSDIYGACRLSVVTSFTDDQLRNNDTASLHTYISYPHGSILINEFMFDVSVGHSEYIELYNSTEDTVNLSNWFFHDKAGKSGYQILKITDSSSRILPKDYFVVATDSSVFDNFNNLKDENNLFIKKSSFNLNSDSDDIVLIDPNGRKIDSLTYSSDWHLKGLTEVKNISLEKTSPDLQSGNSLSWASCLLPEGGTPGKVNSYKNDSELCGFIEAEPNPFSPLSNGIDRFCTIKYNFPFQNVLISMSIYNTSGALVRGLAKQEKSGPKGTIVWDGRTDSGFNLAVGPYILLVEAVDLNKNKNYKYKKMLVIGR